MKIYSVTDAAFRPYGKILEGYDTAPLCAAMRSIPMPEQGTAYEPSIPVLEECALYGVLQNNAYGGMPIQLGLCWGYNTRLNCLEYHRDSEVNVGARDFILLLGKQDEIENGVLDTGKVKAFRVPAGMAVEVYATTLHYAPCHTNAAEGFCTAVVLPRGTNTEKPSVVQRGGEDALLWARNKWLLAPAAPDAAAAGGRLRGVEPGCKSVAVRPHLGHLKWAEGTFPTPWGVIRVRHERGADGKVSTSVSAPDGVRVVR